jgi:hypothetical protein
MTSEFGRGLSEAGQRLRAFEDQAANPLIVGFAHFLGDRVMGNESPGNFVMEAHLAVLDLQRGQDGYKSEPLEGDLVGLDQDAYDEMTISFPLLAGIGYSDEFSGDVTAFMITRGMLAADSSEDSATPEGEVITEEIRDINTAQRLIIDDAKSRVVALDWEHFGITKDEAADSFDTIALIVLRNAPYNFDINVLVDRPEYESAMLSELLDIQKKQVVDDFWLAMSEVIDPQAAMFARDHLFLKVPEAMPFPGKENMSGRDVATYLGGRDMAAHKRAALRMVTYMRENPQILKQP